MDSTRALIIALWQGESSSHLRNTWDGITPSYCHLSGYVNRLTVMVVVRRKEGSFHPQITAEDNDASEGKIEYHLEGNDDTHVTGARGGALIQFSPFDDD